MRLSFYFSCSFSKGLGLQARKKARGFQKNIRAMVKHTRCVVNVWSPNDLLFPLRPVIDFEKGVEFAGMRSRNGVAFAETKAVSTAVPIESCNGEGSILELELQETGRHTGKNPGRTCAETMRIRWIPQSERRLEMPQENGIVIIRMPDREVG